MGRTCLWRISNPTLGNIKPPGVCLYHRTCMHTIHTVGKSLMGTYSRCLQIQWFIASSHGWESMKTRNWTPKQTFARLQNPSVWPTCDVCVQDAALGAGAWLWFWSVYFCWVVFVSLSHHYTMHRIHILSGCLCVGSFMPLCLLVLSHVYVGICYKTRLTLIRAECDLDTDTVKFVCEI